MVSLTVLSQAQTMNLCFAHSQGSESMYFHFCRRCLHPVSPAAVTGLLALPPSLTAAQPAHASCHSHKILMLHFKVWAHFQEDFQDCRQGSGDALTSVWSVSPGWWEFPGMPGAHQPVSSVWRCSIPSSKSRTAGLNILFISPRDKFIFVSISFTSKCCIKQELKAHRNHREKWSFSPFYFFISFLFIWFICFASWGNWCHKKYYMSYHAFSFCSALKLCF